eukprot:1457274-Alexandrium_andersonii.AAC.1
MLRPLLRPAAILACSMNVGVTRFDRFDSLLGSIGTRCVCVCVIGYFPGHCPGLEFSEIGRSLR